MIKRLALTLALLAFAVQPALAGFLINSYSVVPAGPTVVYTDNDSVLSTTNPGYTVDIGTATADRRVYFIIFFTGGGSRTISAFNACGGAATQLAYTGGVRTMAAVYRASCPTGTTTAITTTSGGGNVHNRVYVFAVYGLSSDTPVDTIVSHVTTSSTTISDTIDVSAGGAVFAAAANSQNNGFTWDISGVTETEDLTFTGTTNRSVMGYDQAMAAETGRTITATATVAKTFMTLIAVSIR